MQSSKSKAGKIAFIVIVLIIIGISVWFVFFRMNKKKAIKTITEASSSRTPSSLEGFDEDYLIQWALAIKRQSPDFSVRGKIYSTDTGKSK